MEGWAKVKAGAKYANVSERTFRPWLKQGLRHVRLKSGTVLLKYSWIDEFLCQFEHQEDRINNLVDEIMEGLS